MENFNQNDNYLPETYDVPQMENSGSSENFEKITEISKRAYQLIKENDFENAQKAFEEILKIEDNNNYALVGLGDTERKQNHFEKAAEYYKKCLDFYASNNYALFGLADCYKSQNQFEKAIDIWQQYLTQDDKNITVITRVADAYRKIHDFKKSKNLYLKVLEMEKDNPYALIGLGHLNFDFKEYKDALFYWTRVYEINKDDVDIRVLTSIGNCHRKLKTFDKGIKFFEKALEREPQNFYALFGLADCYRGLNRHDISITYWNKILEIDPNNKVILTRAGDAYRTLGDYKKAKSYYEKALEIDFDIYAAIGLALLCKTEGNYEEAIKRFEKLIKDNPTNGRLYLNIADCYVLADKKNEAIKLLENYLKSDGKNNIIRNTLEKLNRQ